VEGISGCLVLILLLVLAAVVWWWASSHHRDSTRPDASADIPEERLQPRGDEPRGDPDEERPHGA
jgi:hypothetical protein